MKTAVCLHGYFNSKMDSTSKGADGFLHIKKHILDKTNTDVFVHSWDLDNKNEILKLYKPKSYIFEQQIDFKEICQNLGLSSTQKDNAVGRSPETVLSHFYSIQKSFSLVNFSEYDCIVKARFDIGRINRHTSGPGKPNPYPVQCINFISNIKEDVLYMANWQYFEDGPPDMWFYGSPNVMKNFTTLYDDILPHIAINNINAIRLFKWWMEKNNIWAKRKALDTVWE